MLTPGPIYALLTAFVWAVAVLLFRQSGTGMSPTGLNYFKNVVGLSLFLITMLVLGVELWHSPLDTAMLLVSGAVGIGIADTFLFRSLNILGAGPSAIVSCTYSPLIVLFSFLLLDERLTVLTAAGTALVAAAVLLASLERPSTALGARRWLEGIGFGISATALMGWSIVWVKPLLSDHPVLWATSVRMTGGLGILTLWALLVPAARRQVLSALQPSRAWLYAVPGALMGTYVALLLWIAGFKYTTAMTASILNQTSTVWIVLLAALFLREPLTLPKLAAVALGFAGSAMALL